jgi:hypothetical protein
VGRTPIYLDKIRLFKSNTNKMLNFIQKQYPEFMDKYKDIINNGDEKYYNIIKEKYKNDTRMTILFE